MVGRDIFSNEHDRWLGLAALDLIDGWTQRDLYLLRSRDMLL